MNHEESIKSSKVIVLGNTYVGKSSFIHTFLSNKVNPNRQSTLGIEYYKKTLKIDSDRLLLEIWDTAGQERYRSLIRHFFRKTKGVFLIFDISDRKSFEELPEWLKLITDEVKPDTYILLIANKSDLIDSRKVYDQEIDTFCEINSLQWLLVSSLNNNNITQAFYKMGKELLQKENDSDASSISLEKEKKDKSCVGCNNCYH